MQSSVQLVQVVRAEPTPCLLGLLLVVMLASGGAELVSLGAVLPFLAVLSDPERLWQQPLVQALAGRVGFTVAVASP